MFTEPGVSCWSPLYQGRNSSDLWGNSSCSFLSSAANVKLNPLVCSQTPPLPKTVLVFSYANNPERMQYRLQETRLLCCAKDSSWSLLFKSNQDAKLAWAADITKTTPFVYCSLYQLTSVTDSQPICENKYWLFLNDLYITAGFHTISADWTFTPYIFLFNLITHVIWVSSRPN